MQDEDDNNEMGGKSESPGMSHYNETSLPRDDSFGCSSGGRTSNDQNREENTKKVMDVYCVGFDDDNNSDDDDDDDCIIIDTGLGELKVNEPDMIQKEPNCVSQESVDNEVRNKHRFTADCSTTSKNNEASVVEGSRGGNSSEVEADRENHSRSTDAFDAELFLPMKEVWVKDIKAEVLDGACAYSDGLCDILDTSLFDNNHKTSCDSTILDLLTKQTEDDANRPVKNNHLSTNHVASSGCSGSRTAEQAVSSANQRASVLSVADVIHPPEFSLATPVQVDLSTAQ